MNGPAVVAKLRKVPVRSAVRWLIVGLIAVATVINYIDRNALAVMWPEIAREVGATKDDYALLVTVFMLFYAAGQFLFGRLFDLIGTRMGFALSISVWSISIALHAVTHSILSFSLVRAMLGISEGEAPVAVIANMTPALHGAYRVPLPHDGTWAEVLNSDAEIYGGSGKGNMGQVTAADGAAHIVLPPLATIMLQFTG